MISGVQTEVPWLAGPPPEPHVWCTPRARVSARLEEAVASAPFVEVVAPGGFGKTVALTDWVRGHSGPVAWLSLNVHARNPERLAAALADALHAATQHVAQHDAGQVAGLEQMGHVAPGALRSSTLVAHWISVLDNAPQPVVLVVDDCHRVADLLQRGPLAALVEAAPRQLRLVFCGRVPAPALARLHVNGDAVSVGVETLRMNVDEVLALAEATGSALTREQAGDLVEGTGGWPVAVGLDLVTPHAALPRSEETVRTYIEQELLERLPLDLRHLVLSTALIERFDARMAAELSGLPDVMPLLDEVRERGLFLSRMTDDLGRVAYRWHGRFARECRAVLQQRDPDRFDEVSRKTVHLLWFTDPLSALEVARRAQASDLVLSLLHDHWLSLLLEGDVDLLRTCLDDLDPQARSRSTAIAVEAALADLAGDRELAGMLVDRAAAAVVETHDRVSVAMARLLTENSATGLTDACDEVDRLVRAEIGPGVPVHTAALFLLGWSEMRLRRNPTRALSLLRSAGRMASTRDRPLLARRAHANAAFAAAFAGRFEIAEEELLQLGPAPLGRDLWEAYDGGIREFTEGWLAYWRGDLATAAGRFATVVELHGVQAYAPLARVWHTWVVCEMGDPTVIERSALGLREVPFGEEHGLPWGHYARMAAAKVLAARDVSATRIVTAAKEAADLAHVPTLRLEAARLLHRSGRTADVVEQLQALSPLERQPVHLQVGALVINALVQRRRGEIDSAHRLLERSLDLAEPLGLRLAYAQGLPGLRALLTAHVERGSAHGDFLAAVLAATDGDGQGPTSLSGRELEVLHHMRGTLSNAEIAQRLHVSVNTVKTHQRSIYRKLRVGTRREAVRAAAGET